MSPTVEHDRSEAPSPPGTTRLRVPLLLGLALLALAMAVAFRLAVVRAWHAPAGDGRVYHRLSQTLMRQNRLALSPMAKPTYTRLPGYPLFLAYVAVRKVPLAMEAHLVRATRANVVLDVATALGLALLVWELTKRRSLVIAAAALVLTYPLLLLACCYGLTESLATCLGVWTLCLAVLARRRALFWLAAVAGLVAGMGQLVRVDAIGFAVPALFALGSAPDSWKRRVGASLLFVAVAAAVFAPWPARNLRLFGRAYPGGAAWRAVNGDPLPEGPLVWAATWSSGGPGSTWLDFVFAYRREIAPSMISSEMYSDAKEEALTRDVIRRYNSQRLTPDVDAAFAELGRLRARRHPLKVRVVLPLLRFANMFRPLPEHELPMKVRFLRLPRLRPMFGIVDFVCYAFALLGAVSLARRRAWLILDVTVLAILGRIANAVGAPLACTQRYLIPVLPCLIMLAILGVDAARDWVWRRATAGARRSRRPGGASAAASCDRWRGSPPPACGCH
jgi:hypothetical protein